MPQMWSQGGGSGGRVIQFQMLCKLKGAMMLLTELIDELEGMIIEYGEQVTVRVSRGNDSEKYDVSSVIWEDGAIVINT